MVAFTTIFGTFILCLPLFTVAEKYCDVTEEGTTFDPEGSEYSDCDIFILDPLFKPMLDGRDKKSELKEITTTGREDEELKIFHEGPVLFDDALYFTTNRLGTDGTFMAPGNITFPLLLDQYISIMKLDRATNVVSNLTKSISPEIPMANGMTKTADGKNLLVCSQGFNEVGGKLIELNRKSLESKVVLESYYGQSFNSPNDVEITSDGIIFFTDPVYGYEQGFRAGYPDLGSTVYRYDTSTKRQTVLEHGLQRPNGIALLDDRENGNGCTLFVTDSGFETAKVVDRQAPRGFSGFGDLLLYKMKDDGDGCFAPEDAPWELEPVVPSFGFGAHDGLEVHASSKTLLYCSPQGLWIYSIPLKRNIGLVPKSCTQAIFQQEDGLQTVYILVEDKLYTVGLNFDGEGRSDGPPKKKSPKTSKKKGGKSKDGKSKDPKSSSRGILVNSISDGPKNIFSDKDDGD